MDAEKLKEYRKRHNLTQKQLAEITKSSLRAVQYWESQGRKVPGSAIELMTLYAHYPQNEVPHNMNTQGDNNYINDSNNTTQGIQKAQGQSYELKDMKTLLKQLHETKIIEIERLTALYNGIITNQNELISQYCKEIEYLRQKVKEYREKYEK